MKFPSELAQVSFHQYWKNQLKLSRKKLMPELSVTASLFEELGVDSSRRIAIVGAIRCRYDVALGLWELEGRRQGREGNSIFFPPAGCFDRLRTARECCAGGEKARALPLPFPLPLLLK